MKFRAALLTVGFLLASQAAMAQTATLTGAVSRDSAGRAFAQAEVWIPQLARRAIVNVFGDYRIEQLPAGVYGVLVRAIGYAPIQDSVVLVTGKTTERDFLLSERVRLLDSVVSAGRRPSQGDFWREDFEWRRKIGTGHFITTEEMRKHDEDNLGTILHQLPGLQLVPNGNAVYLASGRNPVATRSNSSRARVNTPAGCWAAIYLDGIPIYKPGDSGGPPDLSKFEVREFAAAEYYAGLAQAPLQYGNAKADCGVLLLWTRIR